MSTKKIIWPFGLYFLLFAGMAAYMPYRVLYYQSLSFSGAQIGLLVGIMPLITLVSVPLIAGLADRTKKHRLIMSLSILVVILGLILYPVFKSFALLMGLTIVSTVFFFPMYALTDSATMVMLAEKKDLYGRVRLGGTIGFSIAAAVLGAFVQNAGLKIAFWSAAGIFLIAFLVSQKLVHGEEEDEKSAEEGRASDLLKNPHFLLFLLIGLAGGVSFATINTYLFPYMEELGAREAMMGWALTVGTIVEIPVLFFANRFIKRFKAYTLLIFSLAMTGFRFLLLAIAPTPAFVLFVQLLNGVNYPLLTVAAVTYADDHAPRGYRATAQGVFRAAMGGVGAAIGGFTGGVLIENIGAKGMYLVFCIFVVLILVVISLINRALPPEKARAPLTHSI